LGDKKWKSRDSFLGHYIPGGEPRVIPEDAFVHESVERKIREDPEYHPSNMPARYQVIAMPERPASTGHESVAL
jgi:hypothetical protein